MWRARLEPDGATATLPTAPRSSVDATPRTLDGAAAGPLPLDGGRFQGMPITLGEVMTDADGRLVVLPGAGGGLFRPRRASA